VLSVDKVLVDPDTGRYFVGPSPAEGWVFDRDGIYVDSKGFRFQLVRLDNPHHPSGVFAAHPDIFRLGSKLARYTEGTFNSGVPAGYLKVTAPGLTQPQADDLRSAWLRHHGGDTRSIAVLSATTEFHPISLSPLDSNLIEVARTSWAELAWAFGVAPEVLSIVTGEGNTYSNIRDWWRMHRDFSLSPWVDTVGGTLTALTPEGQSVSVDLDGHSRPDEAERVDTYAKGIQAGLWTVGEARVEEGRTPDASA
jgi:HK97 family phage portal protein